VCAKARGVKLGRKPKLTALAAELKAGGQIGGI
jgi:hypothetical protein